MEQSATISDHPTAASETPLSVAGYRLVVRDLATMARFYREALGLETLCADDRLASLGIDGVELLQLEARSDALPDDAAEAGLHHAAFLVPTRRDLADWYRHFLGLGLSLTRTGDHHVNEALYFDDPEGNGVECYADHPPETWEWNAQGKVKITTEPVDLEALAREATPGDGPWWAPRGMRVGHVNLRVGNLDAADAFYCDVLGLDHTCRRERMTFMSSGRYHHHMAANIMSSAGAGMRDDRRAGLAWFAFEHDERTDIAALRQRLAEAGCPVAEIERGLETRDPWGTRIRIVNA